MLTNRLKNMVQNTNFWTGIGVLTLAVFLYAASFDIKEFVITRVGASFLPRLTAALFAILGGILVIGSFRCASLVESVSKPHDQKQTGSKKQVFGGLPAVVLSILLMCIYVSLINSIGFILTSAGYIFLQILILSKDAKRNYLMFALVSVVIPIAVYFLFVKVFKVMIPTGILG